MTELGIFVGSHLDESDRQKARAQALKDMIQNDFDMGKEIPLRDVIVFAEASEYLSVQNERSARAKLALGGVIVAASLLLFKPGRLKSWAFGIGALISGSAYLDQLSVDKSRADTSKITQLLSSSPK